RRMRHKQSPHVSTVTGSYSASSASFRFGGQHQQCSSSRSKANKRRRSHARQNFFVQAKTTTTPQPKVKMTVKRTKACKIFIVRLQSLSFVAPRFPVKSWRVVLASKQKPDVEQAIAVPAPLRLARDGSPISAAGERCHCLFASICLPNARRRWSEAPPCLRKTAAQPVQTKTENLRRFACLGSSPFPFLPLIVLVPIFTFSPLAIFLRSRSEPVILTRPCQPGARSSAHFAPLTSMSFDATHLRNASMSSTGRD